MKMPVLPKKVGATVAKALKYNRDLFWIFNEANSRVINFNDPTSKWILKNQNEVAKAIVLGTWVTSDGVVS